MKEPLTQPHETLKEPVMHVNMNQNWLQIVFKLDIRYSQKETPVLFSWEFSCNQLAHRESIACNWL